MSLEMKTTPMHAWHKAHHANMSDFAGYDMPLWYETGVKKEHFAVLQSAGIFDTSHMACIRVSGQDAFGLLNQCFTRDMTQLLSNRCTYGAFLDIKGFCIDDAIIYKFTDTLFIVCVNAGMGSKISDHLKNQAKNTKNISDVKITDLSGRIAKIDIQGPDSARILSDLLQHTDSVFDDAFVYFSFKGYCENFFQGAVPDMQNPVLLNNDTPILLSRSGYTGEFGFEIFISPEAALNFWKQLIHAAKKFNGTACGLGARDSLRTGACLPLSHQDIGHFPFIHHPWEFALPFNKDKTGFTKSFTGDHALLANKNDTGYTLPFAGDSLRKIGTGDQSQVLDQNDKKIGRVLSCASDMAIAWLNNKIVSINSPDLPEGFKIKGLSCGFVKLDQNLPVDTRVKLTDGKRSIDATIVKTIRPDTSARKNINHFI